MHKYRQENDKGPQFMRLYYYNLMRFQRDEFVSAPTPPRDLLLTKGPRILQSNTWRWNYTASWKVNLTTEDYSASS